MLLTYVQTMRDEYLSGKADDGEPLAQLRSDLETFGVKAETLSTIKSAYDDNQIRHAVGLISRELSFLS